MSDPDPRTGGGPRRTREPGGPDGPPSARGSDAASRGRPDPSVDPIRFWYRRHADKVYRYARWRTGSRQIAEAVVSDVFLEALRSRDDYDPGRGSVESWLLGIARNVMRRERRRRRREPDLVDPADLDDLASPGPTPEEEALDGERRAELLDAVWELPRSDRDLVALVYGAELSSDRAARILGIRPGAARTRLHRILRRLREKLEDLPPE